MIVLSVLGMGRYEPAEYVWGERRHEAAFFSAALAVWFPEATLKVLATEKAWRTHGDALRAAAPGAERVPIPDGANEEELWRIFNTLAQAIPENEEVIFDITHGFRSLPVLALLATAFLRVAKNVRVRHLLYGAYEQRNEATQETPVFDLTPFADLLDWTAATERFLETGDARKFAALVTANRRYSPRDVGTALETLSEALLTNRPALAQEQARHLGQRIEEARAGDWEARHAPFQLLLERIAHTFSPLADAEPLRSQWAQIDWLAHHGHYPAAAALAREWLVSVRIWKTGGTILPPRDKGRGKEEGESWTKQRREAEDWLNDKEKAVSSGWEPLLQQWLNTTNLRNDLMHCGMRYKPGSPKTLQELTSLLPRKLAEAVAPLGLDLPVSLASLEGETQATPTAT